MPIYLPQQMDAVIIRLQEKIKNQQIVLGEPLREEEICTFEKAYHIKVPEAYRRFLLEVGNGCRWHSGYWLLPLSVAADRQMEKLSCPFPFENEWIWEAEENPSALRMREIENGNLELIDIGCGQTFHLVISGNCRGEVWHFCEMGIQPCCRRQDFLGWFEKWLDGGDDVCYFEEDP